jgi:hypothetical protein
MKAKEKLLAIVVVLGVALAMPAASKAAGESAEASFSMIPRAGTFFQDAWRPANWQVQTRISTADPEILPMKRADLNFPGQGQMRFNPPRNMPVCPDNQVGPPPTDVSQPVDVIVNRCANSVLGNGTAKFVLNRNNLNPAAQLDGQIVVFNGGRQGGLPRLKVYAYSYDTQVGIYTEARLTNQGRLIFDIPQLTADSAVSELNMRIPGVRQTVFLPNQQINVVLPPGRAPGYVQARCRGGRWGFGASFDLGRRDTDGTPIGPTEVVTDSSVTPCTGAPGRPRLAVQNVAGPRWLAPRQRGVYRVRVRNNGTAIARNVRIRVFGRWVRPRLQRVPLLRPNQTRVYRVRVGLRPNQVRRRGRTVIRFRTVANRAVPRVRGFPVRIR